MTTVLVVANRTAQSDELFETLCERAARGPVSFMLVVPATWEIGDPHGGRQTARRRLNGALARLRDAGLEVEGVLGDADALVAVQHAWNPARFDEVIVSTLPARISLWLKRDLPHRVERLTGKPVTHVIASEAVEREPVG
jgi:GABA permease